MKINQYLTESKIDIEENKKVNLVLGFGDKTIICNTNIHKQLSASFPNSDIVICSTAGEIHDNEVYEKKLSLVAIEFDSTKIATNKVYMKDYKSGIEAGRDLIKDCNLENLKYIMIISDGSQVNGSELVKGIHSVVPDNIPVTGGLAGDGADFTTTYVGLNEEPTPGTIVAIGFYGDNIKISHSSLGGWETFGLEKTVTKSNGNELFEVDGKNALDMYKMYLGKYADELPGSALLFPLSVKLNNSDDSVVRTILNINNDSKSMIFAGDVPEGSKVKFMKANFDRLVDAASNAANYSITEFDNMKPELAILISCVGRKLILNERIDEEIEAVKSILGDNVVISGFYSYGEISPILKGSSCQLHNQTMTITCFEEK